MQQRFIRGNKIVNYLIASCGVHLLAIIMVPKIEVIQYVIIKFTITNPNLGLSKL